MRLKIQETIRIRLKGLPWRSKKIEGPLGRSFLEEEAS